MRRDTTAQARQRLAAIRAVTTRRQSGLIKQGLCAIVADGAASIFLGGADRPRAARAKEW
jgi:hypothetical protein